MSSLVMFGRNMLGTFRKEEGQDAFEYLLVIGVVVVAVIGAVKTGFTPDTLVTFLNGKIQDAFDTII